MAKVKKTIPSRGILHVKATFNNTIITVSTVSGDVVGWATGGSGPKGQKGARKATAHAAEEAAKDLGKKLLDMGLVEVEARLTGPGSGRDAAVRGLAFAGVRISTISDITPIPHNGCRRRKQKRC